MENSRRKKLKLISNIASVVLVIAIVGVLFVLGHDDKEENEEETTGFIHELHEALPVVDNSIEVKSEGVATETMAAALGNYIFAVRYEDFCEYSINVYETNGEDVQLINNINIKDEIYDCFSIKELFIASNKLVVICAVGIEPNVKEYKMLCYDVADVENISMKYEQFLSRNFYKFVVKDEYLYAFERDYVISMSFENSVQTINKLELDNDGKLETYINEDYIYFISQNLIKAEYFEGNINIVEKKGIDEVNTDDYLDIQEEVFYEWTENKLMSVGMYSGDVRLVMYDASNQEECVPETYVKLSESTSVDTLHRERKAFVDSERNIFCIGVSSLDAASEVGTQEGVSYYVFSYVDGMFEKKAYVYYPTYKLDDKYGSIDTKTTGISIGDYYYVINTGGEMSVISLETFGITKLTF